jgi:FtsP/CotA-like multicopper oxidase with cupredoxin domain
MSSVESRREFFRQGAAVAAGALTVASITNTQAAQIPADVPPGQRTGPGEAPVAGVHRHPMAASPQHHGSTSQEFPRQQPGRGGPVGTATDRGKLVPGYREASAPPVPVVMPDLPKLNWELKDGVKEFHLVAEHVRREFLPDMWFDVWGYNGSMPGPMIEAVEGDRVRIVVHNNLPEPTTVHWHGLELPNAMDGVEGLTQDPIPVGGTFAYEFDLHQDGTFFYHSHGAMQEVMGMTGLFVVHPRQAHEPVVDHDFGLIMQEFAVLPQNTIPSSVSEEFNFFTINGRSGPYVTPLVVRLGSRVRIRFMNLSAMDNHPMHLHGHTFWVTGTEGGRIPDSAWIPTNNVLVSVGQSRDVEFIANNPGDWMIHCHILHHMMNHMVSMVGPMPSPMTSMHPGRRGTLPIAAGERLASGSLGAGLEPSLGPATTANRDVMNGMRPMSMPEQFRVPGYPQDMMGMHGTMSPQQMAKVKSPLTRGMRNNWPIGVMAMMTVVRVLPDELYERVVSGSDPIEPGASVPGGGAGMEMDHSMHNMQSGPTSKPKPPMPATGQPHSQHQH